jgi:hypothetical protein
MGRSVTHRSGVVVAWRRRPEGDPYAEMPAELAEFDAREWAAPGETPDGNAFAAGDWDSTWDYYRCHDRYTGALIAWFDGHPDADFIEFLRERRARRRG